MKTIQTLTRMQGDAIHRHRLAEENFRRARLRVEMATEDVNTLSALIRECKGGAK